MPNGAIAGLPRYGDGLVIARDPAALWTPLPQRAALGLVTQARLDVDSFEKSPDAMTARLAIGAIRLAGQAAEGGPAGLDIDARPAGLHRRIEASIRVEETTLLKELSTRPPEAKGWWRPGARSPT